jgi:HK97 family phage major capsid protein
VAEGTAKPELTATFVRADAPVRKMAGFIPITEEILADAPTIRSYLDDRLRYMVALREELEILKGNGVAPDLTGILNTAGIQTQGATSGDPATTIANAISKIQLVDGEPDAVVMNPSDWWTMETHRSSGSGQFDVLTAWQAGTPYQVWGLRVVTTRNQTAGHATVGAWRIGAQILRREEFTLRIADQHSDYFVKNLLVMLGESRLALAVHRPDYFCDATL